MAMLATGNTPDERTVGRIEYGAAVSDAVYMPLETPLLSIVAAIYIGSGSVSGFEPAVL
jgi:hypothetical protein